LVGGEHATQESHDAFISPQSRNGGQIVATHGSKVQARGDDLNVCHATLSS
jgi:hypothetical protein